MIRLLRRSTLRTQLALLYAGAFIVPVAALLAVLGVVVNRAARP